jgi:broad specificity phosphatase PhoE
VSGEKSSEIPTQSPTHHPPTGRLPAVFDLAFLTDVEDVTELILVRHGEQDIAGFPNAKVGDAIDPPLSARGNKQAEAVGVRFSTQHVDVVYSSNLERARETGYQIARHHNLEPIVLEDLREVEVFRDIPPDQLAIDYVGRQLLLGIRQRMMNEKSWDVYPYSESSFDFRKRTVNAIEGILATHPGERVVVACHGGVINAYIGHIIGVTYDMFFRPAHASVSIVLAGHGVRALRSLNDVHHLEADALISH